MPNPSLYIGCPMWQHPFWSGRIYPATVRQNQTLRHYARHFNSVEGNTSFYTLPSHQTLEHWVSQVPEHFAFTFKMPKTVSHVTQLASDTHALNQSLQRFVAFRQHIGCILLQLPKSFGPARLPELQRLFDGLPEQLTYAVEVRHPGFFDKQDGEIAFNRLLKDYAVNRIIMDTRGLFSETSPTDPIVIDVQGKKPRVPTHVIETASQPVVRFVGHSALDKNDAFLSPWVNKVATWLQDGLHPYLFFHMPDNGFAPWLAARFLQLARQQFADLPWPTLELAAMDGGQTSLLGD